MSCGRKNCAELSGNVCKGKCSHKPKKSKVVESIFDDLFGLNHPVVPQHIKTKSLLNELLGENKKENTEEVENELSIKAMIATTPEELDYVSKKTGSYSTLICVINNPKTSMETLEFLCDSTNEKIASKALEIYQQRILEEEV